MFRSFNICILLSVLWVNILIKQMFDSTVFIIYWLSLKHLLIYMHVLDWNDEFFTKWKKLWAELNDYKSLMLCFYFYMITMLNLQIFLLIKNDFWIFNNFLMLYYKIHRKNYFIIKLFVAVVDFAQKRLFICFQSLRIFHAFWLSISESAQMLFHLNH